MRYWFLKVNPLTINVPIPPKGAWVLGIHWDKSLNKIFNILPKKNRGLHLCHTFATSKKIIGGLQIFIWRIEKWSGTSLDPDTFKGDEWVKYKFFKKWTRNTYYPQIVHTLSKNLTVSTAGFFKLCMTISYTQGVRINFLWILKQGNSYTLRVRINFQWILKTKKKPEHSYTVF